MTRSKSDTSRKQESKSAETVDRKSGTAISAPTSSLHIEEHPWEPFIPEGARLIYMGTFPPQPKRWQMPFFYPNRINDFWRIMGIAVYGDMQYLIDPATGAFRLDDIRRMLTNLHIAMWDTAAKVRRLRENASDKYLDIVEPVDLQSLLARMPDCTEIATTGQKAAEVIATLTSSAVPQMGHFVETDFAGRKIRHWRMPSTSRAYPMSITSKAAYYSDMLHTIGLI